MFEFREIGCVLVKGKNKAVETFEVIYQISGRIQDIQKFNKMSNNRNYNL